MRQRKSSGWATWGARLLIALALLVGIFAGTVVTQAWITRKSPTQIMAGYGLPMIPTPQSYFHKDRVAILMLGLDYNYDKNDIEYSNNARSDTIKAVALDLPTTVNPTGSVSVLSVPRDVDAIMPDGSENKINAAYTGFGNDTARAAHNSEKAVASFLGVPGFDRYLTLRIDATKELVDAIGGIDVVPDETMNYDDTWGHLHIHFIGGKHYHMNGEQAVSYSRFRHDACSDPCRIKRQDQVIRITVAQLKNDKFNDLLHINALIGVLRRNVYTDLSNPELLSLAWAFQHIDLGKLQTEQVPFVADKTLACCGNVLIADDAAKNALVKKFFLNAPALQAPPDATAVAAVDPKKIHVDVQNGTGVRGEGAKAASALAKVGFVVTGVSNAASFAYDSTEIDVHSAAVPLAGERVRTALALKTATVKPDATSTARPADDVTVIVGRDFITPQSEASAVK
ncbi:MAG: LCP family protein [Candidatus Eremiobacteraeota bacterium]|nr:LCP family protein [Candidatus Eremiobacteraeota bacterium]